MAISTDKFDGVDLSRLPPPAIVASLDFATIRDAILVDIIAYWPEFNALAPADPAYKLVEIFAYRELLLRLSINEAAEANMIAFAQGSDLDHLGARVDLERWVITPGDPARGIPDTLESDDDFRQRIIRAPEGWSVAGPVGAYVDLASKASSDVRFASCTSPAPCTVVVTIQSRLGDGAASPALVAAVQDYLNSDERRPLTDQVIVRSATIKNFAIVANLRTFSGPSPQTVLAEAQTKLEGWLADNERLGRDITADGIHAQLRAEGVSKVDLVGWVDLVCDETQAGHCTGITLNHVGAGQ